MKRTEVARYVPYDDIWNALLKNEPMGTKTYYGGFTGYDDSPRRGNAGTVIFNSTPEKFKVYLADLYAKMLLQEMNLYLLMPGMNGEKEHTLSQIQNMVMNT